MDGWTIGRLVMLAGGLGMVVGAVLAGLDEDAHRGQPGDAIDFLGRSSEGGVALGLLVLGLAVWHLWAWGLGKLVVVGLVAAGSLWGTLVDYAYGTREPLWSQGYGGVELVARWLVVASSAVVLVGVLWSFVEGWRRPKAGHRLDQQSVGRVGERVRSPGRRSQDVAASLVWWRKWGLAVVGVAVALWVGWLVYASSESEEAPPTETANDDDEPVMQDEASAVQDEWSISADGEDAGSYIFSMIRTFSGVEEADVEDLGGRFVWPDTEIELCDVSISGAGDGFVQIGIISPTTEGCPGMLPAFVDFGLPETACLFIRSDGIDDEHCAPLVVD